MINLKLTELNNYLEDIGIVLVTDNNIPISHKTANIEVTACNVNLNIFSINMLLVVTMNDINFDITKIMVMIEYITLILTKLYQPTEIEVNITNQYIDEELVNVIEFRWNYVIVRNNYNLVNLDNYIVEVRSNVNI
ncbi:MAG: hypothetical protein QXR71_04440 [Candidatus Aenigmatarchaeota archaeon]